MALREQDAYAARGRHRWWVRTCVVFVYVLVPIIAGCAGPKVTVKSWPGLEQYQVKSVAVLPFMSVSTPQVVRSDVEPLDRPESVVRSDISLTVPQATQPLARPTTTVPPDAGMKVARIFSQKLRGRGGLVVISPRETDPMMARVKADNPDVKPAELGRRLALEMKTDAVLVGLLRIYKERVGSKYGAEAAAVGFEVRLIAADGSILWVGNYYEEQRPLTEDLFGFFARGFGFVTAEALATYGSEKLVHEFPFGGTSQSGQPA
jgi:hypothetical protein